MARLSSKDDIGWSARGALRRVLRHDNEEYADRPSTGKVRGRRRSRCHNREHDFQHSHTRTYSYVGASYDINRCTRCGKEEWVRKPRVPLPDKQIKKADENFFPIHDSGTCAVCDARREARAPGRIQV